MSPSENESRWLYLPFLPYSAGIYPNSKVEVSPYPINRISIKVKLEKNILLCPYGVNPKQSSQRTCHSLPSSRIETNFEEYLPIYISFQLLRKDQFTIKRKYLELFVPAPTRPIQKIARWLSSGSSSWLNLRRRSITLIFGFDILRMARASGTALFTGRSQYYRTWFSERRAISFPIPSLELINARDTIAVY